MLRNTRNFIFLTLIAVIVENSSGQFCSKDGECSEESSLLPRFILYDVNRPEGFNLRRDVYMRLAIFIREYAKTFHQDVHLVLPPWHSLYHWQSPEEEVGSQKLLFWDNFFDVPSMKAFAPVIKMHEFLEGAKKFEIDQVFTLQHYKNLLDSKDGLIDWKPRWERGSCNQPDSAWKYRKIKDDEFEVNMWGYKNITAKSVLCISFQGEASLLADLLEEFRPRIAVIDHAEVALHHNFGGVTYWKCRRSMRFNKQLIKLASDFREEYLNSNDGGGGGGGWRPPPPRKAIGGPYLAVHLRRKDFLVGRRDKVPTIEEAAKQIKKLLEKHTLSTVFVATDAPNLEFIELRNRLMDFSVLRYKPSKEVKLLHKDGGIAIIDQIICSHARYFIGSQDSTFSFRIQEEREILGFDPDSTFNSFCVNSETECEQPSRWKITY
ncbi:hypothetical protein LSTR_LSTR008580 [Laodelphax striatellus]|uniref:GDP-fucose protein O-fucosyltransferase 2 n=1 Tax=Laodelphax striatellus TaxID=195883 RepID=A0A482WW72_LAOST|nr:hypothetical protein LSTR_LSTR008580 [Laodelphax striatellus]